MPPIGLRPVGTRVLCKVDLPRGTLLQLLMVRVLKRCRRIHLPFWLLLLLLLLPAILLLRKRLWVCLRGASAAERVGQHRHRAATARGHALLLLMLLCLLLRWLLRLLLLALLMQPHQLKPVYPAVDDGPLRTRSMQRH